MTTLPSMQFSAATLVPLQVALAQLSLLPAEGQARLVYEYNESTRVPDWLGVHQRAVKTLYAEREQNSLRVPTVELFQAYCGTSEQSRYRLGLMYRDNERRHGRRRGHMILSQPELEAGVIKFKCGIARPVPLLVSLHGYFTIGADVRMQAMVSIRDLWVEDPHKGPFGESQHVDLSSSVRDVMKDISALLEGIKLRRYEHSKLGELLFVRDPTAKLIAAAALGFEYCVGDLDEEVLYNDDGLDGGERLDTPPRAPITIGELVAKLKHQLIQ